MGAADLGLEACATSKWCRKGALGQNYSCTLGNAEMLKSIFGKYLLL